jgi:hypothetical protein
MRSWKPVGKKDGLSKEPEDSKLVTGECLPSKVTLILSSPNKMSKFDRAELEATVIEFVTRQWLNRLNVMLHRVTSLKDAIAMIKTEKGFLEALLLQQYVLRTVDYMYKHGVIGSRRLREFLEMGKTLAFAAINIYEPGKILNFLFFERLYGTSGIGCLCNYAWSNNFFKYVNEGKKNKVFLLALNY